MLERTDLTATANVAIPAPARAPLPLPVPPPPAAGACATEDHELFVGRPGEPAVSRLAREEDAKRVCARCAVLLECRAAALAAAALPGVRGGLSPVERHAVRRRLVRRSRSAFPGRLPGR